MEESLLIPADVTAMKAAADALESSANRDLFLSFAVGAAVIIYAIKHLYPMFKGRGNADSYKEAFAIITQKDPDGQYVILGIPKLLRGFTDSLSSFTVEIRQLVNHQEETNSHTRNIVKEMHRAVLQNSKDIEEIKRRA